MWRYKQQRPCWMRTHLMVRTLFSFLKCEQNHILRMCMSLTESFVSDGWQPNMSDLIVLTSKRDEVQKEKTLAFIKQEVPRIIVASGFPAFLCLHLHWNLLSPVIVASMSLLGAESFTHFSKAARYIIMVFRCIGCWLLAKSASGSIFFLLLFLVASLG